MYGSGIGTGVGAVGFAGAALGTGSLLLAIFAVACIAALVITLVRQHRSPVRP